MAAGRKKRGSTRGDAAASSGPTTSSDRELVVTRIIDAPRELVFEAWTDPKHLVHWWGPKGFTNPVCEMDVRPGGAYRIVMRGPDGQEYPIKGVYREIVRPERLVYTDDWDQEVKPTQPILVTVTFAEHGGKTKLTIHMGFESARDRRTVVEMGAVEGWNQSLDRLESHLASA